MRILVTDGMDKTALETLRAKGHEVVEQFYAPEELGEAIRDFDVVVVRSAPRCAPITSMLRRLPPEAHHPRRRRRRQHRRGLCEANGIA